MARQAMLLDEHGRGAQGYAEGSKPTRDQRRIVEPRDADGQIEPFFHEVHEAVVQVNVEHDVGMCHREVDERASDGRIGKSARRSQPDRKSTRLNSSHVKNSYAVFCLKKKT